MTFIKITPLLFSFISGQQSSPQLVPVYVNNYGKADHSANSNIYASYNEYQHKTNEVFDIEKHPEYKDQTEVIDHSSDSEESRQTFDQNVRRTAKRNGPRIPWGRLPNEPSFGWVGRTNFGNGPYKPLGYGNGLHEEPTKAEHDELYVKVGYQGEQEFQTSQGNDLANDHEHNPDLVSKDDENSSSHPIAESDTTGVQQDQIYNDLYPNVEVLDNYDFNDKEFLLDQENYFDDIDDESSHDYERQDFEVEYEHLDPVLDHRDDDDDFKFNSNEIYISEDVDEPLSRHERGFDGDPEHFLSFSEPSSNFNTYQSFEYDDQVKHAKDQDNFGNDDLFFKPQGDPRISNIDASHEGFGKDDLFYKQHNNKQTVDLDFDQFYEPQIHPGNEYNFPGGRQQPQRREIDKSFQEFEDIFGAKGKPNRPVITPGF